MASTKEDRRNCFIRYMAEAKRIAVEKDTAVDVILESMQATWDIEAKFEREESETKAAELEERAAAAVRFPEVLRPYREKGTWPRNAKDIIGQLGLRPTRSHLGWVAYQLRLAAPTAQAAE